MTNEEILEHQRREREFAKTDIGKAFRRFENRTIIAWVKDTEGHLRSAEKAFAELEVAREEFIAILRPLAGLPK